MAQRRPTPARRDERGAVAILVSVFALVMFVLAALVVDLGMARETRRDSQNAADASALAAANRLYLNGGADASAAVDTATTYGTTNFGTTAAEWASCTDIGRPVGFVAVAGKTACVSFSPSLTAPTEVRVVMPVRNVKTGLGNAAGVSKVPVAASAQAAVVPGGMAKCGLCVIGSGDHDVQNGSIDVSGAAIYFNGTLSTNPQADIEASGTGSGVYLQGTKPSKGTISTPLYQNQPAVSDPLASLTVPPDMTSLSAKTGSICSGGPGIYKTVGSISSPCTLTAGLYVITGANHLSGQSTINATAGVTLYFACQDAATTTPKVRACSSSGEDGGDLLMTGQASLDIVAPATGGTAGISVLADRNNTATMGWRGNGGVASSGTIYLARGALNYRGNGSGLAMDSLVVVDDLTFNGNPSSFSTTYTQSKNVQIPAGSVNLSR
jgi:hypothetical protein